MISEIAAGVHCISMGRGLLQANVFCLQSGSAWVLVDAGWPGHGGEIRRAAEALFGAQARPAAILLTHLHPDHMGSALELARAWNLPVHVHPAELPYLRAAQGPDSPGRLPPAYLDPIGRVLEPLLRRLPRRRREPGLEAVVHGLDPDGGLPGLPDWECIPTPGHTPGHMALFRRSDRVLIAGDALLTVNINSLWDALTLRHRVSGPPWVSTCDWAQAKRSVALLAALEPAVLAGGHGLPMSGSGTAKAVQAFAERFCGIGSTELLRT